ncbi:MAG: AI-2E family transporter [Mogibacterium sp.]|nr:AI-2E family transporter [Mogibacterium sp.]
MKKPLISLDHKYIKLCSYAAITVIITALILYFLYNTRGVWSMAWGLFMAVLRPIIIGGIISYLLRPVVKKLEIYFRDRGLEKIARTGSVVISIILALAIVFGILGVLVFTLVRTVSTISEGDISSLISYMQHDFTSFTTKLEEYLSMFGLSAERISRIASAIVNGVSNVASGLLFGVIFAIYFMLDDGNISKYWMRALRIISGNSSPAGMKQFLADADRVFSGYIRGQFIDAAIIGVMTTIAMMIIGVPNGTVVGVLTGCGNLIPYVGPVIGYLTLALVCIPTGAWTKLIAGAIVLAILLFVDGNIINPRLLSSNVMVHPLLVVAALIGGGAVGGFVGMLIAVPTAALIKIQFDRYLDKQERKLAKQALEKAESEQPAKKPDNIKQQEKE